MTRVKPSSDNRPVPNVEQDENLLEEVELLRDVRLSEAQFKAGKGVSHREAKAQIRSRIKR